MSTAKAAFRIVYEMVECHRCNGTGNHSYNSRTGTVCFQCKGAKRILSPAGLRAVKAVKELKPTVLAGKLRAGDRVLHDGKVLVVGEVTVDPNFGVVRDGIRVPAVTFKTGDDSSLTVTADTTLQAPWTDEAWTKALDKARAMRGAWVVEIPSMPERGQDRT